MQIVLDFEGWMDGWMNMGQYADHFECRTPRKRLPIIYVDTKLFSHLLYGKVVFPPSVATGSIHF